MIINVDYFYFYSYIVNILFDFVFKNLNLIYIVVLS